MKKLWPLPSDASRVVGLEEARASLVRLLEVGGDPCFRKCLFPEFLVAARVLLCLSMEDDVAHWTDRKLPEHAATSSSSSSLLQRLPVIFFGSRIFTVWTMVVHAILHCPSQIPFTRARGNFWLRRKVLQTFEALKFKFEIRSEEEGGVVVPDVDRWLNAQVNLEFGLAQSYWMDANKGKSYFKAAQAASGLYAEITGALGKRTKFQEKATAQMVLVAKSAEPASATSTSGQATGTNSGTEGSEAAVHEITLDSLDVEQPLLETVAYEASSMNESVNLTLLDQVITLALCIDVKNTNPAHGLTNEAMSPYVARVMEKSSPEIGWCTPLHFS